MRTWFSEKNILIFWNETFIVLNENLILWNKNLILRNKILFLWNENFILRNENVILQNKIMIIRNENLILWNENLILWNENLILWNENLMYVKGYAGMSRGFITVAARDRAWSVNGHASTVSENGRFAIKFFHKYSRSLVIRFSLWNVYILHLSVSFTGVLYGNREN